MDALDIAKKAAEYGLQNLQEVGGPLIPFSLSFEPNDDPRYSQLHLTRHHADSLEAGLAMAYAHVQATSDISSYAIAWDGYATVDDKKWDAILIEVGQSDKKEGGVFAQRYQMKHKGLLRKKLTQVAVGRLASVGEVKSRIFLN